MTEAGSANTGPRGARFYFHMDAGLIGSTKTLDFDGGGFWVGGTPACVGQLHASISG